MLFSPPRALQSVLYVIAVIIITASRLTAALNQVSIFSSSSIVMVIISIFVHNPFQVLFNTYVCRSVSLHYHHLLLPPLPSAPSPRCPRPSPAPLGPPPRPPGPPPPRHRPLPVTARSIRGQATRRQFVFRSEHKVALVRHLTAVIEEAD